MPSDPVDKKGRRVNRPAFIDLTELNDNVDRFNFGAADYVDYRHEVDAL